LYSKKTVRRLQGYPNINVEKTYKSPIKNMLLAKNKIKREKVLQ